LPHTSHINTTTGSDIPKVHRQFCPGERQDQYVVHSVRIMTSSQQQNPARQTNRGVICTSKNSSQFGSSDVDTYK
jgi:hypothetical protein